MTVFALSTGHELGLGLIALAFIVFSLVSALVLPRVRPGFPGRNLPGFLMTTVVFFAAMLFAIAYFGHESKSAESAPAAGGETTAAGTTTSAQATTSAQTTTAASGAPSLAAGKAVFESAGCSGCHTLKAAGATGTVGPNLDQLKPAEARIVKQVTNGGAIMPAFKDKLSAEQIQAVAHYVASVEGQ